MSGSSKVDREKNVLYNFQADVDVRKTGVTVVRTTPNQSVGTIHASITKLRTCMPTSGERDHIFVGFSTRQRACHAHFWASTAPFLVVPPRMGRVTRDQPSEAQLSLPTCTHRKS